MAWQLLCTSREEFENAVAPHGAESGQFELARSLVRQILDAGNIPSPPAETYQPEHAMAGTTAARATVNIVMSGHVGDPASLSVSVSQA